MLIFVVSPVTKPDVVEICNRYGKVVIPGAFTPTEILTAWETGADYVKVFPSSGVGGRLYKRCESSTATNPSGSIQVASMRKTLLSLSRQVLLLWESEVRLLTINSFAAGEFATLTERAEKTGQGGYKRARSGF